MRTGDEWAWRRRVLVRRRARRGNTETPTGFERTDRSPRTPVWLRNARTDRCLDVLLAVRREEHRSRRVVGDTSSICAGVTVLEATATVAMSRRRLWKPSCSTLRRAATRSTASAVHVNRIREDARVTGPTRPSAAGRMGPSPAAAVPTSCSPTALSHRCCVAQSCSLVLSRQRRIIPPARPRRGWSRPPSLPLGGQYCQNLIVKRFACWLAGCEPNNTLRLRLLEAAEGGNSPTIKALLPSLEHTRVHGVSVRRP